MSLRPLVLAALLFLGVMAWHPMSVAAHPLGNFTINHYTGITVGPDGIAVRWVLDMAEIPAFAARRQMDANRDGAIDPAESAAWLDAMLPGLIEELDLRVDGQRQSFVVVKRTVSFPPGQGGLSLLRLVADLLVRPMPEAGSVTYRDGTYPERIGWHEIVVQAGAGIRLSTSTAPNRSLSDELRSYPADALTNPKNMSDASFEFDHAAGGNNPGAANTAPTGFAMGRQSDLLATLVGGKLTMIGAFLGLLLALGLGAAHAISPGHGKTLVAAYLIGSRGSLTQAIWLGVTVAVTHTVGVLVLGIATLLATELLVPERLITWLSLASGLLVVTLGASLVWRHARSDAANPDDRGPSNGHQHPHPHAHQHPHDAPHDDAPAISGAGIAALGLVGGIVPSASALLVLLVAVTTGRLLFGLALIVAFGLGMAIVLAGVSASVVVIRSRVYAGGAGWTRHAALVAGARLVPIASGLAVLAIGVVLTIGAAQALG
jgi:nickel/cobalt transporter (NicO) family protein